MKEIQVKSPQNRHQAFTKYLPTPAISERETLWKHHFANAIGPQLGGSTTEQTLAVSLIIIKIL